MILFVKQNPFIRLLLPLIAGIWFGFFLSMDIKISSVSITITVGFAFGLILLLKQCTNFKNRWIFGVALSLVLFLIGFESTYLGQNTPFQKRLDNGKPLEVIAIVTQPPELRANTVQCLVKIDRVMSEVPIQLQDEPVMLVTPKTSRSIAIKAADVLVLKMQLSRILPIKNPNEFDYNTYLNNQGIFLSGFVPDNAWMLLKHNGLNVLWNCSFWLRDRLIHLFETAGLKGEELGVACSLTIGDKTFLDPEIKQAFISSGTIHVLAVSGMHVALLYWILNLILSFLDKFKKGNYIRLVLLLASLWFYALLTGLSPSVLRATVMFSFVVVGQGMGRQISIFNSLAASAFFLLLWNPANLLDAGFQLSYVAVLAIVTLYPLIYEWFSPENWLVNQIWSITACTLAAQIGTFPVSIFYFHQFPNLFLISNLIIIPGSTLIIYFSLILMCFSFSSPLLLFLGKIFNWLVFLLNRFVFFIDGLPFALWKGIYFHKVEMFLLFGLIFLLVIYSIKKQPFVLKLLLVNVLLLIISLGCFRYYEKRKKEMTVFNYRNNEVIRFRVGFNDVWLVKTMNTRIGKLIEHTKAADGIKNNVVIIRDSLKRSSAKEGRFFDSFLWIRGSYAQFCDLKIALPELETKRFQGGNIPKTEVKIFNRQSLNRRGKMENTHSRIIILDGSVTNSQDWESKDEKACIYAVAEKGAWTLPLE